jgi:hypothetical protein
MLENGSNYLGDVKETGLRSVEREAKDHTEEPVGYLSIRLAGARKRAYIKH